VVLCGAAHGALAQEEDPESEEPRWIPSLSFRFDTFNYETDSSIVNLVNPPAWQGAGSSSKRELQFLGGGELLGPTLEALPGRPRIFASAGLQFNPFSSDTLVGFGEQRGDTALAITQFQSALKADILRHCLEFNPPACLTAEPGDFVGQGSTIEAKFQQSWYASLGLAFGFPLGEDMLLQVKPSIGYNVDHIDFSGSITTVTQNPSDTWANPNIPEYTVHRGSASASTTDHSVGPGLELGLALSRSARPLRPTLFADTRFLWLIGDPTTTFQDSVARYSVHRESFSFRAGAGVRLSWVGFAGD